MTMAMLFALAGIAFLGMLGMAAAIYNSLVTVRNSVDRTFSNIDVVLQQRNDSLANLVEAVKGYMIYERELLTKLVELRTGYARATERADKIRTENELERLLGKFAMVWEDYPDLKAVQNVLKLQGEISGIESKLADYREMFNDAVNIYNIQIERFPDLVLARMLGFKRHAFLEVPEGKKRDLQMKLS